MGLDLGARSELGLAVELVGRELRGEQLADALRDGELGAVDLDALMVVELDRAHRAVLDQEGHDDAERPAGLLGAEDEGAVVLVARVHGDERLDALAFEHLARGRRVARAGREVRGQLARVGDDLLGVGDRDARCGRLGEQQLADDVAALGCEAAADVLERVRRHHEGALGRLQARGIGHEQDGAADDDDDREARARDHGGDDVLVGDAEREEQEQHHDAHDEGDAHGERAVVCEPAAHLPYRSSPIDLKSVVCERARASGRPSTYMTTASPMPVVMRPNRYISR